MGTRAVQRGQAATTVSTNLRHARAQAGLSLRQLAERMTLVGRPMLASALAKSETGERRIDVDDLDALARALGVTPHNLMGWDATPPTEQLLEAADAIARSIPEDLAAEWRADVLDLARKAAEQALDERLRQLGAGPDA